MFSGGFSASELRSRVALGVPARLPSFDSIAAVQTRGRPVQLLPRRDSEFLAILLVVLNKIGRHFEAPPPHQDNKGPEILVETEDKLFCRSAIMRSIIAEAAESMEVAFKEAARKAVDKFKRAYNAPDKRYAVIPMASGGTTIIATRRVVEYQQFLGRTGSGDFWIPRRNLVDQSVYDILETGINTGISEAFGVLCWAAIYSLNNNLNRAEFLALLKEARKIFFVLQQTSGVDLTFRFNLQTTEWYGTGNRQPPLYPRKSISSMGYYLLSNSTVEHRAGEITIRYPEELVADCKPTGVTRYGCLAGRGSWTDGGPNFLREFVNKCFKHGLNALGGLPYGGRL